MALVLQDRVKETSSSSGTGNITLGGAIPGYRTFVSCVPTGSIVYYCIHNLSAGYDTEWEVGYGTFTTPDTLVRTSVYSSSNANTFVNFTAGANGLEVFITYPSEQAVFQQTDGLTEFNEGPISVVGVNATAGSFSSTLAQFTSDEPNYSQLYIQNQSNDANASTDIAAYNELGDGTYFFVDMGIASSAYNQAGYPIFQANDAYLYSYGNATTVSRLMIGTESPNANVVVFAGGVDPNNTALTISGNNQSATFANSVTVTNTLGANNAQFTNFAYSGGNLANAANNTVLVTQAYVDNATAAGIDIHDAVDLATVAVLSGTPTYNQPGGAGNGVGATLTAAGVGFLSVDGQNADAGFRILVQSQANAVQNGVYTVTTEGDAGTAYILTRATDSDTSATLTQGSYYFVNAGDTLSYNAFVVNTVGTIVFGTTNITFAEFSRVPTYIGTSPINVSGQTISLTTVPVNKGGTNLTTFTAGDVVYANTANTISALAIGSQYNTLVVSAGGLPSWGNVALGSANAVSGTLGATNGGTGQSTYTLGDTLYANATNTVAKLAGNTTTTKKFLSQTGDGANSAAPVWDTLPAVNAYSRTSFTATASQTTFSVTYTVNLIQVYVNGVFLNESDYTASNGTSVVLAVACNSGDIVETVAFTATGVAPPASGVSSFSAGTTGLTPSTGTTGNVTLGGTLAVANGGTGVTTSTGSGAVVLGTSPTLTTPTLTTPTITGALVSSMGSSVITSGTAVASTSGTSIDFTSIPSWVKRITVMFSGVSTNGTSPPQVQIGSGSFTTTGYLSSASYLASAGGTGTSTSTTGFVMAGISAANVRTCHMVLTNITGNAWVSSTIGAFTDATATLMGGGNLTLSGTLDRIRITTVNGTDTFDAGSINILYE